MYGILCEIIINNYNYTQLYISSFQCLRDAITRTCNARNMNMMVNKTSIELAAARSFFW